MLLVVAGSRGGWCGLLCSHDDVKAFTNAAKGLAENPSLAACMAASASVTMLHCFVYEPMAEAYLDKHQRTG
jgi:hypothetical protein